MSMQTNLHGRLRNTSLPKSHSLMPLYEAVVNSIHSIEEAGVSLPDGRITVEILRKKEKNLQFNNDDRDRFSSSPKNIIGFKIIDNGVGFNTENMKSFETLDSEHKVDKGCRGIGRLLWLKAFKRINVESIYCDEGNRLQSRSFLFNSSSGVSDPETKEAPSGSIRKTFVHLDDFVEKYQKASPKKALTIANCLLEHCLWYFVREGGVPQITIYDDDEGKIDLDGIFADYMHSSAISEKIVIKKNDFELTHVKLRSNSSQPHIMALCAANRLVIEESITGKVQVYMAE